jgi:hypothetical protein
MSSYVRGGGSSSSSSRKYFRGDRQTVCKSRGERSSPNLHAVCRSPRNFFQVLPPRAHWRRTGSFFVVSAHHQNNTRFAGHHETFFQRCRAAATMMIADTSESRVVRLSRAPGPGPAPAPPRPPAMVVCTKTDAKDISFYSFY